MERKIPDFSGTWKMKSSENFEEMLKALGVNVMLRKIAVAAASKPLVEITQDGESFSIRTSTSVRTTHVSFTVGVSFNETTVDGRPCTVWPAGVLWYGQSSIPFPLTVIPIPNRSGSAWTVSSACTPPQAGPVPMFLPSCLSPHIHVLQIFLPLHLTPALHSHHPDWDDSTSRPCQNENGPPFSPDGLPSLTR
uniref:Cellular retinoic acid binding protein 2, b n=1 Tax=Paramormyrops kingsleyae TaxID=1676925 RepID=A0A3B3T0L3_9TELE